MVQINYFFFYKSNLDLTDILKYELTGPATAATNTDISKIGEMVWFGIHLIIISISCRVI